MRSVLPPALVPAANNYIASQGGTPNIFLGDGSLNPDGVLGLFFNQVEVRTDLTPALLFPINQTGPTPSPVMDELLGRLHPTVILSGPAGRVVVSPFGMSQGAKSWWPVIAVGGALALVAGWLVFGGRR